MKERDRNGLVHEMDGRQRKWLFVDDRRGAMPRLCYEVHGFTSFTVDVRVGAIGGWELNIRIRA